MNKTITYTGFALSSLLIILAFVTAKTYIQLAIAVLLYPLLAYFALKLFPRREEAASEVIAIKRTPAPVYVPDESAREKVDIADIDKRTFLKLVGTAGISFFVFSLLGRRLEDFIFGRLDSRLNTNGLLPGSQASPTEPITTEGYRISEIDDNIISYYGFINKTGGWLIMREDTQNNSFRYAKGNSDFSANWNNRENLKYDYYYNLF